MERVQSTGAIYSHWLALQMYDLIQQQGSMEITSGGYVFSIGGDTIQLDCRSLERMVECAQSISSMHNAPSQRRGRGTMSATALQSSELTVTALLCRDDSYFLMHQMPTRIRHSTPDLYSEVRRRPSTLHNAHRCVRLQAPRRGISDDRKFRLLYRTDEYWTRS